MIINTCRTCIPVQWFNDYNYEHLSSVSYCTVGSIIIFIDICRARLPVQVGLIIIIMNIVERSFCTAV